MIIRKALEEDLTELVLFYDKMCEVMGTKSFMPDGNKGGFPSEDMIKSAILNGYQFVGIEDNRIVAAYILNHSCDESYNTVKWNVSASDREFVVMHALRILPEYSGRGYAKRVVHHSIKTAEEWKQKAVRLDVLEGNDIPEKMYVSFGFKYIDTVLITYEDIGKPLPFKLFEYKV